MTPRHLFLALGVLSLVLSAGLLLWATTKEHPVPILDRPIAEVIPDGSAFGWQHEDLNLGPTEAIEEASERLLQLNDFVYRRYTKGPDSFEVYIGYWKPGTMPPRLMNSHTPDTCWVGAGWERQPISDAATVPIGETDSIGGRLRWFHQDSSRINVIFWHIVDGEAYQYGHQSFGKRLEKLILDPFRHNLDMRKEQFLIRISSPTALDPYWDTEIMQTLLHNLAFTGLANPATQTEEPS